MQAKICVANFSYSAEFIIKTGFQKINKESYLIEKKKEIEKK